MLTDYQNSFTVRLDGKFATNSYLNIPPHLSYVATLPCEISMFKKSLCYSLSSCICLSVSRYTQGDSDVISMPAGFRRHLVGKTLMNVIHCDIAEIRFFG